MCSGHDIFMRIAQEYSQLSTDPSTKVGALILRDGRPVSLGFNHIAKPIVHTVHQLEDRSWKYPRTVHAEEDAIFGIMGRRLDPRIKMVMFTTHYPCEQCAKMIIQYGISEVVTHKVPPDLLFRWPGMKVAAEMFDEAGVSVTFLDN